MHYVTRTVLCCTGYYIMLGQCEMYKYKSCKIQKKKIVIGVACEYSNIHAHL